jgi:hypothetical protein
MLFYYTMISTENCFTIFFPQSEESSFESITQLLSKTMQACILGFILWLKDSYSSYFVGFEISDF